MSQRMITVIVLLVIALSPTPEIDAKTQFITIGTGDVSGVYYVSGILIADLLNRQRDKLKLLATVESTGGSVINVNAIVAGDLEFGLVQSDRQYQAYNGLADWQGQPQKQLRAIFSLHPETLTIVTLEANNISTLADLKGRSVNIGNPGSGQRGNAIDVLSAAGIDFQAALKAGGRAASEAVDGLTRGTLDAFFYTIGHPNSLIKESVRGAHKVRFVSIPQAVISTLTGQFPYYTPAEIPIDYYPGVANQNNVPTLGVRATLCTRADMPDNLVYALTKAVVENFSEFKASHQAYRDLEKENLLLGLTAPIHPGAIKYYREAGLVE